jgi:hypothetical protein
MSLPGCWSHRILGESQHNHHHDHGEQVVLGYSEWGRYEPSDQSGHKSSSDRQ